MAEIDLTRYGVGIFACRGTVWSKRLDGQRLLLLFGERHSLKPFIRDTLLNAIELDKLGVLSCVGVEGPPRKERDIPGWEARQAFQTLRGQYAGDDEKIVEGMLRKLMGCSFCFWETLTIMRPELKVRSVDDAALWERASDLEGLWGGPRHDCILTRLRQSDLFEARGFDPTADAKERQIQAKAALQIEQEWCEHEVNVARDKKLLDNLLAFWDESGTDKIAVINAGSSHQWRIARQLPPDVSYYHIEQP